MRLLVIYNPHAGNGRASKLLPLVTDYLQQINLDAEIRLTEYRGHGIELTAKANFSDFDAIIASGGDGTLFEVLNGYLKNNSPVKPPIGIIPNGTGNAFMKELGLVKSDWKKAIDIISKNSPKKLDVGRMKTENESYYFINTVGVGFVAKVAKAAVPLKWMGNAAYTFATILKLMSLKAQKMEIEVDGKVLQRNGIFAEVANSTYTGTTFLMAPKARLDDGLLDLVLLNDISRIKLLRLFKSIYNGSHIKYPEVEYMQARTISIKEQRPGQLIPDGEILAKTPVKFECLPGKVWFLWD